MRTKKPKKESKVKLQVYITPAQLKELEYVEEQSEKSRSEIIRELIQRNLWITFKHCYE